MRRVDRIVDCVDNALKKQGVTIAAVERWKAEMPTEAEMEPKDKYTIFARNARGYRKGVHSKPSSWRWWWKRVGLMMANRGTKVDESQSARQSPRFLDCVRKVEYGQKCGQSSVYIIAYFTLQMSIR